uniref:Uncharacterized protein n=1 Tax=Rhizophora mucronata TaxID=61149 RepID=A0A2P2PUR4_RHIMU
MVLYMQHGSILQFQASNTSLTPFLISICKG